ncbi:uncharacterized protein STEHIDRAFT_62939, partial [Stereum hirsutum FP-91666 SS1]|uniref:uncharacterized protein n=1 Tax=Stereum hirsutum (strain FP-91666) TaxID=721885 RepID=UPI0004449F14
QATAEGNGRSGHVYTTGRDPPLDLRMHPSKDLGGVGRGHNPEQLFAMAYSSCFLESLQNSLCRQGKGDAAPDVKVHTSVYMGHYTDSPQLGLKVHVTIEGVEDDDAIIEAQKVSSLTFPPP